MKPFGTADKTGTKGKAKVKEKPYNTLQKKRVSKTKDKVPKEETISAKRLRQKAFISALDKQQFPSISRACRTLKISRFIFYDWRDNDPVFQKELHEWEEAAKDQYEENLYRNSAAGDSKATIFFLERKCRDRGYGKEADSSKMRSILKRAMGGEITPMEAAYQINILGLPLPEVLKLQLARADNTPPPDDDKGMSVEEMERRAQEAFQSQNMERTTFLPERRQDVIDLKEQMKNVESFGPDVTE